MAADPQVTLRTVDEALLARLLTVATEDASADEVTPPLTPGPDWTPRRRAWFVDYHRSCRAGLTGPAGEATWAIVVAGEPVGCVRLKRTGEPAVLETGIWIRRSARGAGIGVAALTAVLGEARAAGAGAVCADTAVENRAAQVVLRRAGFALRMPDRGDGDGRVRARAVLPPDPPRGWSADPT